jgi:sugar phosphate isomerase/epimerase
MPINQIGICSWSLQPDNPATLVELVERTGIQAVQLAMTPLVQDDSTWSGTIQHLRDAGIAVLSGMMAPLDEDYTSLETIALTGGIRPDATWEGNLSMARDIAALASESGIDLVSLHAGFMPKDPADPERSVMLDRIGRIVDVFAEEGIEVAFETGQETAETVLELLRVLDRTQACINFDPANMILYGKGDPIDSLRLLVPHVRQVHIKDALPSEQPGSWGTEVPAGTGAVDWSAFLSIVDGMDRPVNLIIEREGGPQRVEDIVAAGRLLGVAT